VQDLDEVKSSKTHNYKASVPRPPTSSSSQPQTDNKRKGIERSIPKSYPQTKCYKCQGYGHIGAKYASPYKIALIDEEGYPQSEGDEYIHQVDGDEEDFVENTEEITLNCLRLREYTRLSVIRCTLAQPKVSDDWRHTNIFHIH